MRRGGVVALVLALAGALAVDGAAASDAHDVYCVKWRTTKSCDPHGVREPRKDAACSATIPSGISGFCECEGRRRVREVDCDHHAFTCDDACAEDSSAELSCTCTMLF